MDFLARMAKNLEATLLFLFFTYRLIGCEYSPEDLQPVLLSRQLVWRKFLNLNNPAAWRPTQTLPCAKDRLVLPENYAFWIDRKWTTTELVSLEKNQSIH